MRGGADGKLNSDLLTPFSETAPPFLPPLPRKTFHSSAERDIKLGPLDYIQEHGMMSIHILIFQLLYDCDLFSPLGEKNHTHNLSGFVFVFFNLSRS